MKNKLLLPILSCLLLTFSLSFGQVSNKINYQAVARNASGLVIQNQNVSVRLSIHSVSATGAVEYSETHASTTNNFGVFNLKIGNGTVLSGNFNTINWGDNARFLEVEIDPAGGTNFIPVGTSELVSVPHALYAKNADNATNAVNATNATNATNSTTSIDATNATNSIFAAYADSTRQWYTSGNDIVSSNTGNVGIGTTSPISKLEVASGDARINGIIVGIGSGSISTNTVLGEWAFLNNTTGFVNTAIGSQALQSNTTGNDNTAVGKLALNSNTTGIFNTSIGSYANNNNTTGSFNTAIGKNTLLGNVTGTNLTALGKGANVSDPGLDNATAIGAGTIVSASNSLILGNNANVGIGTSTPGAKLDVIGNVKITDGTEGAGKVLTSDASGTATWQTPGTGIAFKAYAAVDQVLACNQTFEQINFGNTIFNLSNSFDNTTSKFTAPSNGIYHFDAAMLSLSGSAGSNFQYIFFVVNGGAQTASFNNVVAGLAYRMSISDSFFLNAGDQVTISIYGFAGSTTFNSGGYGYTYFSGYKVF